MRILVTGGAGFIGSHVAKALAQAGHVPIVFDSLLNGHRAAVKWGDLVVGDIRDTAQLTDALKNNSIEAVIHVAGLIEVGESVKDPLSFYDANTVGSLSLARALKASKVKYLVFSSTAAIYGLPQTKQISEGHPKSPVNPYGWSKLAAERIFFDTAATGAFSVVPLRYFNAAGADPEGELGENHSPETHLIPRACLAALGKVPPLQLFGDNWPTPDRTAIRDYIHVSDLATAHLKALEYLVKGGESQAFNLGTGQGKSVREVLTAVSKVAGKEVPTEIRPRRAGDPPVLVANPAAAHKLLVWKPQYATLDKICQTAWDWFSQHA